MEDGKTRLFPSSNFTAFHMRETSKTSTVYSAAVRRTRAKVTGERMNGDVTNLCEASKEGQTPRREYKPIYKTTGIVEGMNYYMSHWQ